MLAIKKSKKARRKQIREKEVDKKERELEKRRRMVMRGIEDLSRIIRHVETKKK